MKKIKEYADIICEEIESAKEYAEKYVECKVEGNAQRSARYKQMSNEELDHASFIHTVATEEIEKLKSVYEPPVDMMDKWEHLHKEYIEKVAWIKQMLAM